MYIAAITSVSKQHVENTLPLVQKLVLSPYFIPASLSW